MRFLDYLGNLHKARRSPQQGDISGQPTTEKLYELVKKLSARVQELEAKAVPEALEVELTNVTHGVNVAVEHGFDCPVRFYVVHSTYSYSTTGVRGSIPTVGVMFAVDSSSTNKRLVLTPVMSGGVAWKVVLRIEPSQYGVKI
jgi:hypothetical protein